MGFKEIGWLSDFYQGLNLRKKLDQVLAKEITKRKIKYIFDVGIGFATFANKLLKKGIKVYGIEIKPERIKYIKNKIKNNKLTVKKKDATKLNFKEEFDGAYCISLCQIGKYLSIIRGVYKALKPNGYFFVDLYVKKNRDYGRTDFRKHLKNFSKKISGNELNKFQTALEKDTAEFNLIRKDPKEWENTIKKTGFEIEKQINYYPGHVLFILRKKVKN